MTNASDDRSTATTRAAWLQDLTFLLRLRGVDGRKIGDTLAQVEAHCDDAGQEPLEAFGEPAGYAASLRFAPAAPEGWTLTVILPALGLMLGVNLVLGAALSWSGGVAVTVGLLASMVVFAVMIVVLVVLLKPIILRRAAAVAWFAGGIVAMVVLPLSFRHEVLRLPSWLAMILGVALAVVGVLAIRRIPADPIVDPRASEPQARR